MKELRKISLTKLNMQELEKKQQQQIFGGNACKCGSCGAWATTDDNVNANYANNYTITGTNDPICYCPIRDGIVYSVAVM